MEIDNHNLVLTFGSQLDQSLKNLHRTVLGSVSDQQQQLRCMEEHIESFLASKCDASKVLESKIGKIKVIYSSGVHAMKDLAEGLEKESSLSLNQIKSAILAQTTTIEDFLGGAVKEFEEVIQDIHSSLDEQKHILAFSAQQQEEGLKRCLVSAQVISKETMEFFNDLQSRFSKLMKIIEADQIGKSQQLAAFGKTFEEESLMEEKLALEKIAQILGTLTSKKTDMVSKALRNMDTENIKEKARLEQEILNAQNISSNAIRDWDKYFGKVQCHFVEDIFSVAEKRATMEIIIQDCSKRVDDSRKQWEHTQLCVDHFNKDSIAKIGSIVKEKVHDNHGRLEEIKCLSSSTCATSDASTCDLLEAVNNSLQLDHEMKEEIESISTLCFGQLKQLQEKHGENISFVRNRADQCLTKEYKVEKETLITPAKRAIIVPAIESIEELRAPALEDMVAKLRSVDGSKGCNAGSKVQHQQLPCSASPNRTPFAAVN